MVAKDYDFGYVIKDSYIPKHEWELSGYGTSVSTSDTAYWQYTYPNTFNTYWYPSTVYMYQIFCPKPRCKGIFWGSIDSIVACSKCGARVKITNTPPPDYEVAITK
jgi:hypothetical protein